VETLTKDTRTDVPAGGLEELEEATGGLVEDESVGGLLDTSTTKT
jgi:hypothetical protein